MGAEEPAATPEVLRRLLDAQDGEDHQSEHAQQGEQVLDEAEPGEVADDRDLEVGLHQADERFDDREQQDHEAPEHEEMRHSGHRPAQQLALEGHLGDFRPDG